MKITLKIADLVFYFESDVQISKLKEPPYQSFFSEGDAQNIYFRIRQYNLKEATLPPLTQREINHIKKCIGFQYRWIQSPIFRVPQVRAVLERCLIEPESTHIELAWNRAVFRNFSRNEYDLFYPLEKKPDFNDPLFLAGFRNMMSFFLPNFQALMIHGGGVIRNNLAALFLASDEGGKTSVIKSLSPREGILSDDHLIIKRTTVGLKIHATPFGQFTDGPREASLGGVFMLEKSSKFQIIPINPIEVVHFLLKEQSHKWYTIPNRIRSRAFNILYDTCHQAPLYRMQFPKKEINWNEIDAAMAETHNIKKTE